MRTTSIVLVGALVIAATALYLRHEPPTDSAPASESRSIPNEPAPEPAARPQVGATTVAANGAPSSDRRAEEPGAPRPAANAPAPITETMEDLKLPPIPEILETERAFAAEAVDPDWSPQAEAHILDEVAQATGLKLVTLRVDCKTRLCRLHMAQQELSRDSRFPDLVDRTGLKPLWVVVGMDRNGVPTSIAYLERK